jgi:hypothetical protein
MFLISLKADTRVLAMGSRLENKLVEELKGMVPGIHLIGDCKKPRNVLEAINEGGELVPCL